MPTMPEALDRLLRKLYTLEPTVRQLLRMRQQTAILEKKLSQLEELVIDIPSDYEELAIEWRDKLANWWREFAEVGIIAAASVVPSIGAIDGVQENQEKGGGGGDRGFSLAVQPNAQSTPISKSARNEQPIAPSAPKPVVSSNGVQVDIRPTVYNHTAADSHLVDFSNNMTKLSNLWQQLGDGGCTPTVGGHNNQDFMKQVFVSPQSKTIQPLNASPSATTDGGICSQASQCDEHSFDGGDQLNLSSQNDNKPSNWWRSSTDNFTKNYTENVSKPPLLVDTSPSSRSTWWRHPTAGPTDNITFSASSCNPFSKQQRSSNPFSCGLSAQPQSPLAVSSNTQNVFPTEFQPSQSQPASESNLSPNDIRTQLEKSFDSLVKVESISDNVEGFKAIIAMVTKADRMAMAHWKDNRLQSDLLGYAFRKLPSDCLQLFLNIHKAGNPKTVRDLKCFLIEQINRYYGRNVRACVFKSTVLNGTSFWPSPPQSVASNYTDGMSSAEAQKVLNSDELKHKTAAATPTSTGEANKYCHYCKTVGHLKEGCKVTKSALCYGCYQNGHTIDCCPLTANGASTSATSFTSVALKTELQDQTIASSNNVANSNDAN